MSELNLAIVRRWFDDVWNLRREDTIDELITDESVCYTDEGPVRGIREFKERQFLPFTTAFPDLRVNIDAIVAQDDVVVVRWSAVGRHSGVGLGFIATNDEALFRGITWLRLDDGKMVEGWQSTNIPEVIRGLGAKAASLA